MEHAEVKREEMEAVKVQLLSLLDVSPRMSRILENRCVSACVCECTYMLRVHYRHHIIILASRCVCENVCIFLPEE